jgi:hypothetical protein
LKKLASLTELAIAGVLAVDPAGVRAALASGADVNVQGTLGKFPLEVWLSKPYASSDYGAALEILGILLDHGADLEKHDESWSAGHQSVLLGVVACCAPPYGGARTQMFGSDKIATSHVNAYRGFIADAAKRLVDHGANLGVVTITRHGSPWHYLVITNPNGDSKSFFVYAKPSSPELPVGATVLDILTAQLKVYGNSPQVPGFKTLMDSVIAGGPRVVHHGIESQVIDGQRMLDTGLHSDVTVIVTGDEGSADPLLLHKVVLSLRSEVLAEMCGEGCELTLVDPVVAVQQLVQFIYTGRIADGILEEHASSILEISDKYAVQGLKSLCEAHFAAALTDANSAHTMELARRFNAKALLGPCRTMLRRMLLRDDAGFDCLWWDRPAAVGV